VEIENVTNGAEAARNAIDSAQSLAEAALSKADEKVQQVLRHLREPESRLDGIEVRNPAT
jgi:hypothetical protein